MNKIKFLPKVKFSYILLFFIFLLFIPVVNAGIFNSGDITFSVEQKDYYFKIGENAVIPLNIENTYGKDIDGTLINTYTQEINQGGMHMSSSNSQSISFSALDGDNTQMLSFGTVKDPSILNIDLKFVYTEKEARIVKLDNIKVHFVSDDNQKQNKQNKQTSSSEKQSTQQQNSQQQDPLSQMQQQLNQIMGKNQQNTQTSKQALQNSQMSQDSSALKKQMEKQVKEQQEMNKEFQKQLAKNKEIQKEHQNLLNQGYNLTNMDLNPSSNNTGDFKLNYEKPDGKQASLKGKMQDGQIKDLEKSTAESKEELFKRLEKNKKFRKYQKQLENKNYSMQDIDITKEENKTLVKVNYLNNENKTAIISADIINNTIKNIKLEITNLDENKNSHIIIYIIILITLFIIGYFFYKRYNKKNVLEKITIKKVKTVLDYRDESIKLLNKAKKLFKEDKYKDAYGVAGQALRMFLSYKNNLNKEISNDEIINYLKKNNIKYKLIKECFDICSLVEFAKYKANKKDFNKIIESIEKVFNSL